MNDASTGQLMDAFYRHWRGANAYRTKAEALRLAQAEVSTAPGLAPPRYWAGFRLVGVQP